MSFTRNIKMEHFYQKWGRIIVVGIGVLVFALFVICVMLVNGHSNKLKACEDCTNIYDSDKIDGAKMNSIRKCSMNGCVVTCRDIQASESIENELQLTLSQSSCNSIKLTILNTKFPWDKIEANWLKSLAVEVEHLEIKATSITHIEDDAFASNVFMPLRTLTMEGTNIRYLQKNALRHLNLISTLEFSFTSVTPVFFEEGLLEHVSTTLETLQFNYCKMDSKSLANITGSPGVTLNQLQTLDLRFSTFKSIESGKIVNTPRLVQIFLNENSLTHVDVDAFSKLSGLKRIYLNTNSLERLPEGVFRNLNVEQLYLQSNPWVCDCDLKWLKDFYLDVIADVPTCASHNNENFTSVEFCPTVNEMTTKITSIATPDTSTAGSSTTEMPTTTDVPTTERSNYEAPSIDMYSRGSYLTANGYAKVKYRNYRPPILNTVSENVPIENDDDFDKPMTPNTFRAYRFYAQRKRRFQEVDGISNGDYEMLPPLPPLNNSAETRGRHDEHLYSMM